MKAATHRLCTAPMMDWSDRHCRYFFRQLAPHAVVYTEMVTTGALLHGDLPLAICASIPPSIPWPCS